MWKDVALYLHYTSAAALFADMRQYNKMPEALNAIKSLDTMKLAEDFKDVESRMYKWFIGVAEEQSKAGGGNVLVVSHGIAINAFLASISEKPFISKQLDNASVSEVTFENGKFKILSVGDMQYVEACEKMKKP